MKIRIFVVVVLTLSCLMAVPNLAAVTESSGNAATVALHKLFTTSWQREMREHPLEASLDGFHQYDGEWADMSLATIAREHAEDKQTLKELAVIPRDQLSREDRLSYDLFKYRYTIRIEGYHFHGDLLVLNQLGGIQTLSTVVQQLRFEKLQDYRNYIKRLRTFAPYMDQTLGLLREGVKLGMTEPHEVMMRIPRQITANIVTHPEQSAFYAPFKKMPSIIPAAEQAQLRAEARSAIADVVVPAYRHMLTFFNSYYLPHCRRSIAASALPDGKAYYAYEVRKYTTTDMTPAEIHALGLREVAKIHAKMQQIIHQVGFKGDYHQFLHYLRTNPRFYYKNPRHLLEAYRAAAKRVDPHLVQFFPVWLLPRVTYGVQPIPAAFAPDTYPAYSVPPAGDGSVAGYMAVNLYKPQTRPKYDIQVLTCHEGRPGHQLQIPIAMGLKNLPDFRRFDYYNAYGEGWALYTERLCGKMGLYNNPYSRFGYLDYQMWRAVRLVVDTGIHSMGWSRERAIRYFEDNTALSHENITNEVDRYIAWPAQALSYMIGELEILRLRRQAEKELGPKFDIKAFHAAVLEHGGMPLNILKQVVDRWIRDTLAGKPQHARS